MPARATRPPVLLVHGYFANAAVFDAWLPFFAARGFPAYAVNLRGRAGSGVPGDLGRVAIQDFVDDATEVARHIGDPVVVGHSMGGLIAQRLAEEAVVRAAVLLTPAPPRGIMVLTPRVAWKQLRYLPWILTSKVVVPRREDLREIVLNRIPAAEQDGLLDQMVPDSGRAGRDMSITGVPVDPRRVRCPILVVAAEEDRFIPKHIVARIAARYGATLVTMERHAHMLIAEPGWHDVADAAAGWIEALWSRAASDLLC